MDLNYIYNILNTELVYGVSVYQMLISLGIVFMAIVLRRIFSRRIFKHIKNATKKTKTEFDDLLIESFKRPLEFFIVVMGIYMALLYLPLNTEINRIMSLWMKALFIILIAYGLYKLEGVYSFLFNKVENRLNIKRSNILKSFGVKIFRFITISLTLVILLDLFGFDVNAFVAGFGLAGLAVAMAAQDTIANVFAGLTIILDKPFDVGDRILSNGIDGIVEDINFRSTRIRTLDMEFVTIPNSSISNGAITNFTKRDSRKIKQTIGVTYSSKSFDIQKFIGDLKGIMIDEKRILTDSINVALNDFGASSIDILVIYKTNTNDWNDYLEVKETINYKIMELMTANNLDFAFPSTSVYFENQLETNK